MLATEMFSGKPDAGNPPVRFEEGEDDQHRAGLFPTRLPTNFFSSLCPRCLSGEKENRVRRRLIFSAEFWNYFQHFFQPGWRWLFLSIAFGGVCCRVNVAYDGAGMERLL